MIEGISGGSGLLNGLNIEELLRKKLKQDPLEQILHPDAEGLIEQAAPSPKDSLSVSAASLEAANDMLKEFNAANDYVQTALEAKQMDESAALDALATEFDILDYMSAEMRDAVLDAAAKGARKKNDDVYAASEENVNEIKEDIERAAAEATAPKDAEGNPIEVPGQPAAHSGDAAAASPPPAPQAAPAADVVVMDVAAEAADAPAAPKVNIRI